MRGLNETKPLLIALQQTCLLQRRGTASGRDVDSSGIDHTVCCQRRGESICDVRGHHYEAPEGCSLPTGLPAVSRENIGVE